MIALVTLVRYRALVPFIYLLLLCEHLARRAIALSYAPPGAHGTDIAWVVNYGLLTLLILGLALSLIPARALNREKSQ